jgi:hypothetical protein
VGVELDRARVPSARKSVVSFSHLRTKNAILSQEARGGVRQGSRRPVLRSSLGVGLPSSGNGAIRLRAFAVKLHQHSEALNPRVHRHSQPFVTSTAVQRSPCQGGTGDSGQVAPDRGSGNPVSDPASFASITSASAAGACAGLPSDAVEIYAGESGLQYLGDGYWQFNWKTPKSYAGQCRTMTLTLNDHAGACAEGVWRGTAGT